MNLSVHQSVVSSSLSEEFRGRMGASHGERRGHVTVFRGMLYLKLGARQHHPSSGALKRNGMRQEITFLSDNGVYTIQYH